MTKMMRKWRTLRDRFILDKDRKDLWWLKVSLFPKSAMLAGLGQKCSLCRNQWSNINGAINHVSGVPHFRQWCLEHTERAVALWGEEIRVLIAEEVLAGTDRDVSTYLGKDFVWDYRGGWEPAKSVR